MPEPQRFSLETSHDRLTWDRATGRLLSLRSKAAPDVELLAAGDGDPVFVVQYLEHGRFRQLRSSEARAVEVAAEQSSGGTIVTASFSQLGGLELDVSVRVRVADRERLSYWSLTLRNEAGLAISDVQFPFVVCPYRLAGTPGSEALLWPLGAGVLLEAPTPQALEPDTPHAWQMRPENSDSLHYPGYTHAQFLAYGNDRSGVYISCQDPSGLIKLIKPVHYEPGLRLGIAHVGDWPQHGERTLPYEVALGTYNGDWYAAAELYRDWSREQPWCATALHQRRDVPAWLLESPPHIVVRIQGELDLGPATPNEAFLPLSKTVPLLERIAERVDAPLVPVIMSWERPGPWVYPDCFPPAGGADALREFTELARTRGWHIGTFCNGTRWVTGHFWSGYDGEDDYERRGGAQSICRTHTGEPWREQWDATWRPSYACCIGTAMTREIAVDFVRTVLDYGLDWIQFFDQNIGCATFPCFAADHDHPPLPGRWMTERMQGLIDTFHELGHEQQAGDSRREAAFSVEGPVNEYFLPGFQICDIRVVPPGHQPDHRLWHGFVPLYHFLYHEFVLIQGGFGYGPEPYHMPIRNAYNLVVGEIPGGVLTGDGRLLNRDTANWAPWEPPVGDDEHSLRMLRAATALRRGPASDFLVYGRMLAPARVEQIATVGWQHQGRDHRIPAVFHAAWQAPNERFGIVLANWTDQPRTVAVVHAQLGGDVTVHIATERVASTVRPVPETGLALELPPLSCALLEPPRV